jgi:hypothetical protein
MANCEDMVAHPIGDRFDESQRVTSDCIPSPEPVTCGFLVLKRFEVLYGEFASKETFAHQIYAIPVFGTTAPDAAIRYRGLDRAAAANAQLLLARSA